MKNKKYFLIVFAVLIGVLIFKFSIIPFSKRGNDIYNTFEIDAFPIEICCSSNAIYYVGRIIYSDNSFAYKIYKMDKNNYSIEEVCNFEISEKTLIKKIVSLHNNLYFYVYDTNDEPKCEIWKIDENEEIVNVFDISQWIDSQEGNIRSLCINDNDICYIRDEINQETLCIDLTNGVGVRIHDTSENVSFESMALGTNGNVFMLFCRNLSIDGGYEIVEFVDDQMKVIYCGNLLPYDDIYSVMGTGNSEFEVFIKGTSAIYGFSKSGQEIKYIRDLSLEEYKYTKSCFLDGKRILIFGMNPKIQDEKIVNKTNLLLIELVGDK